MIECLGVSKSYGQVSALTDVTFELAPGVVAGLVGQNGAGKSTLLKLLAGLLRPSQGDVLLDGRSPQIPAVRRELGFCPDIDAFYEDLTGLQFVTWMLRLAGYPRRDAIDRARETLERLALGEARDRRVRGYSKGMRQRVKLAQTIAHDPRFVLLDEPMTGLDPVARHDVAKTISALARDGVSVLVSSHVLHELQTIADRILLIHQGRLLAEGTIAELRRQLQNRPHRLLVRSRAPRELAAMLARVPMVLGLEIRADSVEIAAAGSDGLLRTLTEIGADPGGLIEEMAPVDETLEAVFGYLVG